MRLRFFIHIEERERYCYFGFLSLQEHPNDVYYLNCGSLRERFRMRLNESKENIDHAREAFQAVIR